MQCCRCFETKEQPKFAPEMVTMPTSGILCLTCQEEIRQQATRNRTGFFSCMTCQKVFLNSMAVGKGNGARGLNCSSRDAWTKGEQTC